MAIKSKENSLGAWAFLVGVILAIVIGLSTTLISIPILNTYSSAIYAILIVLGLIVGFANVTSKDSQTFLMAGAVLVIVSGFGMNSFSGSLVGLPIAEAIKMVFSSLLTLFVPATIVVALKTVFNLSNI